MILKKIAISYYSDNLKYAKESIINILKEYGIFELELVEDFEINILDYDLTSNKKEVWAIIFYLPNNRFFDKKLLSINEKLKEIDNILLEIYVSDLDTNSYKDEWKKHFFTTKLSDRITINPSWIDYTKEKDDEIVISIDPSIAFGTGAHETTALCINFLEEYVKEGLSLLDIGCGSGVLMLVASKLSAKKVVGIDIDKNCELVVKDNFRINKLDNYEVYTGNLVDKINDKYDIVVSNILVDVLELLLKDIKKVIKNNTICIFSGILISKEDKFIKLCEAYGLHLINKNYKNKWCGLVFQYRS